MQSGIACAETWTSSRGDKGVIRGVWQVTIEGSAITGQRGHVGAKREIQNGTFVAHRVESSRPHPLYLRGGYGSLGAQAGRDARLGEERFIVAKPDISVSSERFSLLGARKAMTSAKDFLDGCR